MPKDMVDELSGIEVPTFSGNLVSLTHPEADQIHCFDVMRGMALHAVHFGCIRHFYSWAQRSLIASYLAEDMFDLDHAKAALMCYTPVAYMGLGPVPLMQMFPESQEMFDNIAEAIYAKIAPEICGRGMTMHRSDKLAYLTNVMRAIEDRDLRNGDMHRFDLPPAPEDVIIAPMNSADSYIAYRNRFIEILDCEITDFEFQHDDAGAIYNEIIKPGVFA